MSGSVLFDLDGTLTDPFIGITSSIQHALRQMGREPPLPEDLRRYIGPPLQANFMEMLGDEVLAAQAVGFYRARYGETGKFENELIPGMTDVLQTMTDDTRCLSRRRSWNPTRSISSTISASRRSSVACMAPLWMVPGPTRAN
jgi:phosphoglycolate phosphatase